MKKLLVKKGWVYDRMYAPGETVEVPDVIAARLHVSFPGCFEEIKSPAKVKPEKADTRQEPLSA